MQQFSYRTQYDTKAQYFFSSQRFNAIVFDNRRKKTRAYIQAQFLCSSKQKKIAPPILSLPHTRNEKKISIFVIFRQMRKNFFLFFFVDCYAHITNVYCVVGSLFYTLAPSRCCVCVGEWWNGEKIFLFCSCYVGLMGGRGGG